MTNRKSHVEFVLKIYKLYDIQTNEDICKEYLRNLKLNKPLSNVINFKLYDIQTNENICKEYLRNLKLNKPLSDVIKQAHNLCPELKIYCEKNSDKFKVNKSRDKGNIGKIIEFNMFGKLPNIEQKCDLPFGDIKTTDLKKLKSGNYNAKERITITNCGKTAKYETFNDIINIDTLKNYKHYTKIRNGILFVSEHIKGKYNSIEEKMNKLLLKICIYDIEKFTEDVQFQIQRDFEDIQDKIKTKTVSQRGQKILHIHPHGSKDSTTRALGFKNSFVTKLIAYCCNLPIVEKGTSVFIEKQYL
jgi:hypothetical protein